MSENEKISYIRQVITLVCDILPQVISLVKEVIVAIRDIKTV